jgi:hypothetical protein
MEDSVQYKVRGWQNADVPSLIAFLERKASAPNRPPLKIIGHVQDSNDSVIITVSAKVAHRFAHLDGFTFAGSQLSLQQVTGSAPVHQEPVKASIPNQAARFRDEGNIGANFVTTFFPQYDSNRQLVLQNFYDANSAFSLSVNTRANRIETSEKLDHTWSSYIKKSRNLTKITPLPARRSRSHRRPEAIFKEWTALPATRPPTFDGSSNSLG